MVSSLLVLFAGFLFGLISCVSRVCAFAADWLYLGFGFQIFFVCWIALFPGWCVNCYRIDFRSC